MLVWCGATIALGAALAGMVSPATEGLGRAYYAMAAGFDPDAVAFDAPGARFAIALLGAVTIGWGLTMLGIVRSADAGSPLWRHMTLAVVGWFGIDSLLSIAAGFPHNAALNIGFIGAYLIPVIGSGVMISARRTTAVI
jgi:hypothetical protein